MQLELTGEEARTLQEILRDTLPDLRREVARTESHSFRHELVQRQELCERLVAKLESVTPSRP
jgi:hypothetical protein